MKIKEAVDTINKLDTPIHERFPEKKYRLDSKNSLFLVKVGNFYISDSRFKPDMTSDDPQAEMCSWTNINADIKAATRFDSLEQAAIVADYCGGKVILMEPREIAVHRNRQEPGD